MVIAMDGPAGSGKSTAARRVAAALGLAYLDTGAMYRALTWWLQDARIELTDTPAVLAKITEPAIEVGTDPASPHISIDGRDVAAAIRTRQVSNSVSTVAAIPQVRARLIGMQKDIIAAAVHNGPGIVAEGRDIGTVVAPDAAVKVYLTASEQVRAQRRSADLAALQQAAVQQAAVQQTVQQTLREQAVRDRRDAAQMLMAADAVEIDTSDLALDEVVGRVVAMARAAAAGD